MEPFQSSILKSFGGLTGGVTPDPISNSEVKTSRADGTAGEALWESRSPPEIFQPRILTDPGLIRFGLICAGARVAARAIRGRGSRRNSRKLGRRDGAGVAGRRVHLPEGGPGAGPRHRGRCGPGA